MSSNRPQPPIRAVFFDLDGVLADTEPLHLEAIRRILAPHGIRLSEERYLEEFLPVPYREVARTLLVEQGHFVGEGELEQIERFIRRDARQLLLREARPFPQADAVLEAAARRGPIGLVTSTDRSIVDPLLTGWGWLGRFDVMICGDDVPRGKPAPDPYLRALEVAATAMDPPLQSWECLVFEDTPHGIRSAIGAGMRVIGVATTLPADRLGEAERVIDRLAPDRLPF